MKHEESQIQAACVRWFRYQYGHLTKLLFAVPNGSKRDVITGRILKAEGTLAGVADLLLLYPSKQYHGLCIEMKTEKGRQQDSQKEWQTAVEAYGYKYIICRSLDQFREELTKYIN